MINHLSTWQVGQMLDQLKLGKTYAGLHTSEPNEENAVSTEVTGSGYRRQQVTWRRTGRALVSDDLLKWTGLHVPVTVVAVALYESEHGTTLRGSGLFPDPVVLSGSSGLTLGAGELVLYLE